jgi:hypothetical protein
MEKRNIRGNDGGHITGVTSMRVITEGNELITIAPGN